jgi:hypothetical protein
MARIDPKNSCFCKMIFACFINVTVWSFQRHFISAWQGNVRLLILSARQPIDQKATVGWDGWDLPLPDRSVLTFSFCLFLSVRVSFERENVYGVVFVSRVLSWSRWGLHQWELRGRLHGSTFSSTGNWGQRRKNSGGWIWIDSADGDSWIFSFLF